MDDLILEIFTFPIGKNDQQIEKLLKILTKNQKLKIKRFVKEILSGRKSLTDAQYRSLSRYKEFLRNLGCGRFSVSNIINNYNAFAEILKILFEFRNESNQKSNFSPIRRMGKNKKKRRDRKSRESEQFKSYEETETEEEEEDTYSEDSFESTKSKSESNTEENEDITEEESDEESVSSRSGTTDT